MSRAVGVLSVTGEDDDPIDDALREPPPEGPDLLGRAELGFERALSPFESFIRSQSVAAALLFACAVAAFVLANSDLRGTYEDFKHVYLGLYAGQWALDKSFQHWVNDGLMALFFFVLGLEIKRELLAGELREPRRAMLVILAAAGGIAVPAGFYWVLAPEGIAERGWAIPMATDTAFALGALALLGKRAPAGIATFLAGLAIVDDMAAVSVIALVYSDALAVEWLSVAGVLLVVLFGFNALGVRRVLPYTLVGLGVWLAVLHSGLHATIAGVLVATAIPARPRIGGDAFARGLEEARQRAQAMEDADEPALADGERHALAERVRELSRGASTPLRRWENSLEYPIALLVMPLFAFLNAGVSFGDQSLLDALGDPMVAAVAAGLVLGKPLGIVAFAWLGLRLGVAHLPRGVELQHLAGAGFLAGMGFTMSIFIASLAFDGAPRLLANAKLGILGASVVAGVVGLAWLLAVSRKSRTS